MAVEWGRAKISQVAHRVTKGTTPTTVGRRFVDAGIAFVKVESILGDGRLDAAKLAHIDGGTNELLSRSALCEDDVLFTIAGTIGRVAMVPSDILPANTNQAVAIVRPNHDVIHPRFLYYALRDGLRVRHAHSRVVQSVQANFSLAELGEIEIPLPPKQEQLVIAGVLGALDDKIDVNRRLAETLGGIARTLFNSWFVDFDPVRGTATLPDDLQRLFPDQLVDSKIGLVPQGWEVTNLGRIANINRRTLKAKDLPESILYVEISSASGGVANPTDLPRDQAPSRARRSVQHGDTVVSTVRPERGAHFLALHPSERLIVSTGFATLTPTSVPWSFLYSAVCRPEVFEHLGRLASGAAYPAVRAATIAALPVVLPPQNLSEVYQAIAAPLFERAGLATQESLTLAELRDTLLPKLISGEIRLGAA